MSRVFVGLFLLIILSSFSFVLASEANVDFYVGMTEDDVVSNVGWNFFEYFVLVVLIFVLVYFVLKKNKISVKKKKKVVAKKKSSARAKKKV